jgi:hypothetical protein
MFLELDKYMKETLPVLLFVFMPVSLSVRQLHIFLFLFGY